MRDEPCKQCGALDKYIKGEFSYCRPCHTEAQRRYAQNKKMGISRSDQNEKPPVKSLESLINQHLRNGVNFTPKIACPRHHPYSGDNLRVQVSKDRIQRRCRACERDAKRVRYGLKPQPDSVALSDLLDEPDQT